MSITDVRGGPRRGSREPGTDSPGAPRRNSSRSVGSQPTASPQSVSPRSVSPRSGTLRSALALAALCTLAAGAPAAALEGRALLVAVETTGTDAQPLRLPGAAITVTCPPAADGAPATARPRPAFVRAIVSDDQGTARIDEPPVGTCRVDAQLAGFQPGRAITRVTAEGETAIVVHLGVEAVREDVTVAATGAGPLSGPGAPATTLDRTALERAPLATDRFQEALPLVPGVVRGPDGLLNINGSRSNQTRLTVDQSGGTDPVTGEFAIEIPVDAIESVDVQPATYAAELGQSAGAVAAIATQSGGEAWRVRVNNFMPRIRVRDGTVRGLESFTPRVTVGGPIVKGRLYGLGAAQYVLTRTRVESQPDPWSDTEQEGVDGFGRMDWTISEPQRLTGVVSFSPRTQRYAGLDTFNAQPVTPSVDTDGLLIGVGDQIVTRARGVIDLHASYKRFDVGVAPTTPGDVMILGPDLNGGSFFNSQDRQSHRVEALGAYTFTPGSMPGHLWKAGVGLTREWFDGVSVSRPVEIVDAWGDLLMRITFPAPAALEARRTLVSGYVQDTWTVSRRLTVQYGLRADRDGGTTDTRVSPRASFTLAALDGQTTLRGGAGLFAAAPSLNVLAFDDQEDRVVSDADAGTPAFDLSVANRLAPSLHMTRNVTWDVQVERRWRRGLVARIGYRQREGSEEPTLHPAVGGDDTAVGLDAGPVLDTVVSGAVAGQRNASAIWLRTDGRSRYREGQVTLRYTFNPRDQVVASYTRSASRGDLNAVNGYLGNVRAAIVPVNERGRLPWDAPSRVLVWGSLGLPRGFDLFPVLEIRDGFPISTMNARREFVGGRNAAGRYPRFVSLDVQVMRRIRVAGRHVTLGLKVFNLTDHFNPRDYFGNVDGLELGRFANGVGRTFRAKLVVEF